MPADAEEALFSCVFDETASFRRAHIPAHASGLAAMLAGRCRASSFETAESDFFSDRGERPLRAVRPFPAALFEGLQDVIPFRFFKSYRRAARGVKARRRCQFLRPVHGGFRLPTG